METWTTIKNFELYEISTFGRIRRIGRDRCAGTCIVPDGFESVALLNQNGRWINRRVHLLMAENFMDGLDSFNNRIVHIDGDRSNNRLDNLRIKEKDEKIFNEKVIDFNQVKYLVNKIECRGWIDAVDILRIASIHTDIYGDIYNGDPQDQIPHMYNDLKQYIQSVKK